MQVKVTTYRSSSNVQLIKIINIIDNFTCIGNIEYVRVYLRKLDSNLIDGPVPCSKVWLMRQHVYVHNQMQRIEAS